MKRLALVFIFLIISLTAWTQVTITGTVIFKEDNSPIPGANIVEKGTPNGTTTKLDGTFEISVADKNAVLIGSFVGYRPQEISINGRDKLRSY